MEELIEDISDHPKLGLKRKVQFEGIDYIRRSTREMQLVFVERFLDSNGNLIDGFKGKEFRYFITNSNVVNANGITITLDRVRNALTQRQDETNEEFDQRVQQVYENQISQGTPQFNYYLTKFGLGQAIRETISIIKQEEKFD